MVIFCSTFTSFVLYINLYGLCFWISAKACSTLPSLMSNVIFTDCACKMRLPQLKIIRQRKVFKIQVFFILLNVFRININYVGAKDEIPGQDSTPAHFLFSRTQS